MNKTIEIRRELRLEISHLNSYGVDVEWFYNTAGTNAIGVGDGFVWSVDLVGCTLSTSEAKLGEWSTGIEI